MDKKQLAMQIIVRTISGKEIALELQNDSCIEVLMEKIEEREGIPVKEQRLIFGGRQLELKKKLEECGMGHGSSVQLQMGLNGAGIKGLTQVIEDNGPGAIKEIKIQDLFGRKIAIDASMAIYGFLIAIRPDSFFNLTNQSGEATSHLQGIFYRTLRLLKHGIKPVYVFDGKPPTLKGGELAKRSKKKKEAETGLENAKEEGNTEEVSKLVKRTVKVTKEHIEDCKKLLKLMGMPIVEAPCEAEAQCAEMVKGGLVWATGTEDMDSLTFGTKTLLRNLNFSDAKKKPIKQIDFETVLTQFDMTRDQFTDLCILLGCDYCDTIKGIGKKRAFELIKKHGSIEKVLKNLDENKYKIPENFNYEGVRELFKTPVVTPSKDISLKWGEADEEGLLQFLVQEKGFNEDRVKKGIQKLKRSKSTQVQERITSFFTLTKSPSKPLQKSPLKTGAKKGKGNTPLKKQPSTSTPNKKRKLTSSSSSSKKLKEDK